MKLFSMIGRGFGKLARGANRIFSKLEGAGNSISKLPFIGTAAKALWDYTPLGEGYRTAKDLVQGALKIGKGIGKKSAAELLGKAANFAGEAAIRGAGLRSGAGSLSPIENDFGPPPT